jgi:predicted porin
MIFPKTAVFGEYEYQFDVGWVNNLNAENQNNTVDYRDEITWQVGAEYLLSRNFSLMISYDNRFGAGGGISAKF